MSPVTFFFPENIQEKKALSIITEERESWQQKKAQALDTRNLAQATLLATNNKYDLQAAQSQPK